MRAVRGLAYLIGITTRFLLLFLLAVQHGCKSDNTTPSNPDAFRAIPYPAVAVAKSNPTKLYVHYMPWFESKDINGRWGIHWTMANRNPDVIESNGKRQIASHFYPSIGPYSSRDADVIEYHLLLMKLTGIDGVLIDWYGTHDVFGYRSNRINTEALIDRLDDVGLEFAIVYEDYAAEHVADQNQSNSALEAARSDVQYLYQHYVPRREYIHINSAPLLLVFGPRYFQAEQLWSQIFSGVNIRPCFLTLWYESPDAGNNASGEFGWVYRHHLSDLDNFYRYRVPGLQVAIGSAYPGFRDFYQQGGWGQGLGWSIDHNASSTLTATLTTAAQAQVPRVQLVTWNDFGEGTMIEPTEEFGFSFLEVVQQFAGVRYSRSDLESVARLYQLRKQHKHNPTNQLRLDQVFFYLVSLQVERAKHLLGEIH